MLDISEKRFLAILPQINFLLSLLIVFHHGFISIVRYNGSFFPFSYGLSIYRAVLICLTSLNIVSQRSFLY